MYFSLLQIQEIADEDIVYTEMICRYIFPLLQLIKAFPKNFKQDFQELEKI